jgi:hypothetical protein
MYNEKTNNFPDLLGVTFFFEWIVLLFLSAKVQSYLFIFSS